jgi:hypothetical protein
MINELSKFVELKIKEHTKALSFKSEIGDEVDMITLVGYLGAMVDVQQEIERLNEKNIVCQTLNEHIEKYELMLERNENDCVDKALISAILEELNELKDDL